MERAGHVAYHVTEIGLGPASDLEISAAAVERQAILVSKDEDFVQMAQLGHLRCPLLWIRLGNTTNAALWQALRTELLWIVTAFEQGEQIIEIV